MVAKLAQLVETDFVGAPVGIMDQMACSVGRAGEALLLDTHSLAFERVPLPSGAELLVLDSGVTHRHAGGQYSERRHESLAAAELLGVSKLRELQVADLSRLQNLPPVLARRARHVVTENQRVIDMFRALREGHLKRAGTLMNESHVSMRDDYEVSIEGVDRLVSLAQAHPAVYGARLTGGGFGGAIVGLVEVVARVRLHGQLGRPISATPTGVPRCYWRGLRSRRRRCISASACTPARCGPPKQGSLSVALLGFSPSGGLGRVGKLFVT